MRVRFFKRKPKPKPGGRPKGGHPDLAITNESEATDGGGGVDRDSYVALKRTDDEPHRAIQLAVRVRGRQEVKSLKFHRSFQWGEMVPTYVSGAVATAANVVNPAHGGDRWIGFEIPANEFPRPFYGTAAKFKLKPVHGTQKVEWMVCYAPNNFTKGWISGESELRVRRRRGQSPARPKR